MQFELNSITTTTNYQVFKIVLTFKTNLASRYKTSKLRFARRIL